LNCSTIKWYKQSQLTTTTGDDEDEDDEEDRWGDGNSGHSQQYREGYLDGFM